MIELVGRVLAVPLAVLLFVIASKMLHQREMPSFSRLHPTLQIVVNIVYPTIGFAVVFLAGYCLIFAATGILSLTKLGQL